MAFFVNIFWEKISLNCDSNYVSEQIVCLLGLVYLLFFFQYRYVSSPS